MILIKFYSVNRRICGQFFWKKWNFLGMKRKNLKNKKKNRNRLWWREWEWCRQEKNKKKFENKKDINNNVMKIRRMVSSMKKIKKN